MSLLWRAVLASCDAPAVLQPCLRPASPGVRGPRPARRRVPRPPYEQLVREIDALGYLGVGRKYGVSDNAIRKWRRAYEADRAGGMPSGVAAPRAAGPATAVEGGSVGTVQGVAFAAVDGEADATVQGAPLAAVDGEADATVQGAPLAAVQGGPVVTVEGPLGTANGAPVTPLAPQSAVDAAAAVELARFAASGEGGGRHGTRERSVRLT
jgi:hypothetical protein